MLKLKLSISKKARPPNTDKEKLVTKKAVGT